MPHTPGPYAIANYGKSKFEVMGPMSQDTTPRKLTKDFTTRKIGVFVKLEDAQLFTAAPDLLKRVFVRSALCPCHVAGKPGICIECQADAYAIAKTEGKEGNP